jgi:hypothetical protein
LRAAGFPDSDLALLGPSAGKKNLVVRLHGTGRAHRILTFVRQCHVPAPPKVFHLPNT